MVRSHPHHQDHTAPALCKLCLVILLATASLVHSSPLPLMEPVIPANNQAPCSSDPDTFHLPQCQQHPSIIQPRKKHSRIHLPRNAPGQLPPFVSTQLQLLAYPPDFAVVISVHNHGHVIGRNLATLLDLTRGIWQLVVVFDDCTDSSHTEATAAVSAHTSAYAEIHSQMLFVDGLEGGSKERDWECRVRQSLHSGMDSDRETAVSTEHVNSAQSNSSTQLSLSATQPGEAVVLHSLLTEVTFIVQPSSVWETTSDNLGLSHASPSKYFILVQADMRMLSPGWNLLLSTPAELFADVFSVSARCAHAFPGANSTACYGRCSSEVGEVPTPEYLAEHLHRVYLPGTVSRGPLLLRADRLVALGLLDEQNFMLGDDDHDLMARALVEFGWRAAGYLAVPFVAPPQDGSSRKHVQDASWSTWARDTVMKVHRAMRAKHHTRQARLSAAALVAVPEVRDISQADIDRVSRFWSQRLRYTLTCASG